MATLKADSGAYEQALHESEFAVELAEKGWGHTTL
jgi:hypothetical protein